MQVSIVWRHSSVASDLQDYANKKLFHLQRLSRRIEKCGIIFGRERKKHVAEMVLSLPGGVTLVASVRSDDLRTAVDMVVEKLERQLDKYKVRRERKRHMTPQVIPEWGKEKESVEKED